MKKKKTNKIQPTNQIEKQNKKVALQRSIKKVCFLSLWMRLGAGRRMSRDRTMSALRILIVTQIHVGMDWNSHHLGSHAHKNPQLKCHLILTHILYPFISLTALPVVSSYLSSSSHFFILDWHSLH